MNILVTGGAGFIGSHLCRRLISEGNSVICLDNLSSGSMKGIEDLLKHPSFRRMFSAPGTFWSWPESIMPACF